MTIHVTCKEESSMVHLGFLFNRVGRLIHLGLRIQQRY